MHRNKNMSRLNEFSYIVLDEESLQELKNLVADILDISVNMTHEDEYWKDKRYILIASTTELVRMVENMRVGENEILDVLWFSIRDWLNFKGAELLVNRQNESFKKLLKDLYFYEHYDLLMGLKFENGETINSGK